MSINPANFIEVTINTAATPGPAFGFGRLIGIDSHTVTANRVDGPFASYDDAVAAGFTALATPTLNLWLSTVFSQAPHVDEVVIGRRDVGDANLTASLDAIVTAATDSNIWYHQNVLVRTNADILATAAWTEPRMFLNVAQSNEADLLNGVANNIGAQLKALGYRRTALAYYSDDAKYLDGGWSSRCGAFNLDAQDGAGIWMYKKPIAIEPDNITNTQALAIWAENANVFGVTRGRAFMSKGTVADGTKIDIITTNDWMAVRMQEAILDLQIAQPGKIAYDDTGIAKVGQTFTDVISVGLRANHFNRSEGAVNVIISPNFVDIPQQLRAQRKAIYTARITYAGAIEFTDITIVASF